MRQLAQPPPTRHQGGARRPSSSYYSFRCGSCGRQARRWRHAAAAVGWRARRTPRAIGSVTRIARPIGARWAIPISRVGTLAEVMAAYRCRSSSKGFSVFGEILI